MLFFKPLGMGVPIVLHSVANQPHTPSPHFASFPTGLPDYLFKVLFFTAPPQYHKPSISSTISLPIYKFPFISPTSYRNPPMGPPPYTSFSEQIVPYSSNPCHIGAPVSVFVHLSQVILYLLYKGLCFQHLHYLFVVIFGALLPFFGKRNPCRPWLGHSLSATFIDITHIL
jgi:hypothetical protein